MGAASEFELLALVAAPVFVERLDEEQIVFANDPAGVLLGLAQGTSASGSAASLFASPSAREVYFERLRREGTVAEFQATLVAESGEQLVALLSARSGVLGGVPIAVVSMEVLDELDIGGMSGSVERDLLTGLHNLASFNKLADREIERARRYERMLCFALIDVDGLRQVNDRHGFLCGDEVVGSLARAIETCVREIDEVARFGDDEFAVLLPETGVDGGRQVLERLREDIAGMRFGGPQISVTVTVGVSELLPEDDSLHDVVGRAQIALRTAKSKGGNSVRAY